LTIREQGLQQERRRPTGLAAGGDGAL